MATNELDYYPKRAICLLTNDDSPIAIGATQTCTELQITTY